MSNLLSPFISQYSNAFEPGASNVSAQCILTVNHRLFDRDSTGQYVWKMDKTMLMLVCPTNKLSLYSSNLQYLYALIVEALSLQIHTIKQNSRCSMIFAVSSQIF